MPERQPPRGGRRFAAGVLLPLLLAACASDPPPCPPLAGPAESGPSAGCLVLVHGRMLVVEGWNGRVGPPGGHVEAGEDARCAAHRETWEETGLNLRPGKHLATFDTGFRLYQCHVEANTGAIDPPDRLEVRRAYWLPVVGMGEVEWRFPRQGEQLRALIQSSEPAPASR